MTAVVVLDDNRQFLEVNDAALELLGMHAGALAGRRLDDIASEDTRRHIEPMWLRFLRHGHLTGTFAVERSVSGAVVLEFDALANFPFPGLHLGKLRAAPDTRTAPDSASGILNRLP